MAGSSPLRRGVRPSDAETLEAVRLAALAAVAEAIEGSSNALYLAHRILATSSPTGEPPVGPHHLNQPMRSGEHERGCPAAPAMTGGGPVDSPGPCECGVEGA